MKNNQTTAEAIAHALDKIEECAVIMLKVETTVHTPEYRHNIFQMSYNMGRLSELTGLGREVYDTFKPEISSGLLNGWNTIKNEIVPAYRQKFLVSDPNSEMQCK